MALHIEAIVLGDGSELMVTSNEDYFIGVLQFEKAQESNGLYAVGTSIYVVSKE